LYIVNYFFIFFNLQIYSILQLKNKFKKTKNTNKITTNKREVKKTKKVKIKTKITKANTKINAKANATKIATIATTTINKKRLLKLRK